MTRNDHTSTLTGKSIAILPFVDMSQQSENEYFGDGITEEIINAMTRVEGLQVTARTSSFAFKNKNMDVREIGAQLGVASILEGSIRMAKDKVRITAQLINVADGFHYWSETFDRSMEDIFAVQDEISLLMTDKLRENFGHFEIEDHLLESFEIPVDIYKSYLKARFLVRQLNKPDGDEALAILKKVIEREPNFPLAYLEIHAVYTFFGLMGLMAAEEAFAKAKQYLNQAIELDENLPECQFQLAQIHLWQKLDLERACQLLIKALQQRPSYADAHQLLALI